MSRVKIYRLLRGVPRCSVRPSVGHAHIHPTSRTLHTSLPFRTDGVFRALTESRITVPWIDAFNKIKNGEKPHNEDERSAEPRKRDLTPKKMSDSYHRVVCGPFRKSDV